MSSYIFKDGQMIHFALSNGDCLTQAAFHKIYKTQPSEFCAELIDGTVFVREPLGCNHGLRDSAIITLLGTYSASTKGTGSLNNATVVLSRKDEVQPDAILRIEPNYGGQSGNTPIKNDMYFVKGAPELVVEVAHSGRAIDLHLKRERYTKAGVLEYLVICLNPEGIIWIDVRNNLQLKPDQDGTFRSKIFPGLWIHEPSLLERDLAKTLAVLNEGINSVEHAVFVEELAKAYKVSG